MTLLLALLLAPQDDPPPPAASRAIHGDVVQYRMTYSEPIQTPASAPAGGGGLVGAVNRVAGQIAGAGGASLAGALVDYVVEPVVEETADKTRTVRLKVRTDGPRIDPEMPEASRTLLTQEASFLQEELQRWTKTLEPTAVLEVIARGTISLPVIRPLTAVRTWKRGALTLTLREGAPTFRVLAVRFFLVGRSGVYPAEQLVSGMPALAEVEFEREPPAGETFIQVDALPQGERRLRAVKLEDRPTVFRTGRFLPWTSDGGLDVPPPPPRDR